MVSLDALPKIPEPYLYHSEHDQHQCVSQITLRDAFMNSGSHAGEAT